MANLQLTNVDASFEARRDGRFVSLIVRSKVNSLVLTSTLDVGEARRVAEAILKMCDEKGTEARHED